MSPVFGGKHIIIIIGWRVRGGIFPYIYGATRCALCQLGAGRGVRLTLT